MTTRRPGLRPNSSDHADRRPTRWWSRWGHSKTHDHQPHRAHQPANGSRCAFTWRPVVRISRR